MRLLASQDRRKICGENELLRWIVKFFFPSVRPGGALTEVKPSPYGPVIASMVFESPIRVGEMLVMNGQRDL
jgi:hypothetical protein